MHLVSKSDYYGINSSESTFKKDYSSGTNGLVFFDFKLKTNDKIILVLDTEKGDINLTRNDDTNYCLFRNIRRTHDSKYKFGVWLKGEKCSVALIDSDCTISS